MNNFPESTASNATKLIVKVESFCTKHHLIAPKQCLLIACSGGPDSMALADVFFRLQKKYSLTLHIAHAEHGIRSQASLEDAAYVKNWCVEHNLPFHIEHLDVPAYVRSHKLSEETAARLLRYAFLRRIAQKVQADKILTAHHLNDQAETVLLHLLRGAGPQGLSGIQAENGDIIRPFLCLYRSDIEAYCTAENIHPRHDETNDEMCCERNKIRLGLLPGLKKFNKNAVQALCRSAQLISDEHDFIKTAASDLIKKSANHTEAPKIEMPLSVLQKQHTAVRREAYRQMICLIGCTLENIAFEHIDKIDHFLYNGRIGALLQLPGDIRAIRDYKNLTIFLADKEGKPRLLAEYNIVAKLNGSITLPGRQLLTIRTVPQVFPISGNDSCFIDADKLAGTMIVRSRRNGDRMRVKGMNGSKKIKDILIDSKIPAAHRSYVPLVCDDDGIIWLAGVRQSSHCCIDSKSRNILYMKLEKLD